MFEVEGRSGMMKYEARIQLLEIVGYLRNAWSDTAILTRPLVYVGMEVIINL